MAAPDSRTDFSTADALAEAQAQARWLEALAHARDRMARFDPPFIWQEAARRMASRLSLLRLQPQQVIDAACAWGDGLGLLRAQYPRAQVLGFEPAPALADVARQRQSGPIWRRLITGRSGPWVRTADIGDPEFPGQAELLWSNLDLHTYRDRAPVLAAWRRRLQPEGALFFTCFGPDTLRELGQACQRAGLPARIADFPDMHDLGDELVRAGFADPVMDMDMVRLSWADAAAALRELRGLGATPHPGRDRGLRTPRAWQRLLDALAAMAGADGRVQLRFEIIYGHAFRPRTERAERGTATFDLDSLRRTARHPGLPGRSGAFTKPAE